MFQSSQRVAECIETAAKQAGIDGRDHSACIPKAGLESYLHDWMVRLSPISDQSFTHQGFVHALQDIARQYGLDIKHSGRVKPIGLAVNHCPVCQEKPALCNDEGWYVACPRCGMRGPRERTVESAITAWSKLKT